MIERRAYPRYPITFPVKFGLSNKDGELNFNSECVDISRSSIQISCDSELVEALLANDEYPHTARLEFNMPGDSSGISVVAQVVTHRRLSQDHYYLVLVFSDFHKGSDEQLTIDLREFQSPHYKLNTV